MEQGLKVGCKYDEAGSRVIALAMLMGSGVPAREYWCTFTWVLVYLVVVIVVDVHAKALILQNLGPRLRMATWNAMRHGIIAARHVHTASCPHGSIA